MDGVGLSQLLPGLVYQVPVSLGTWLTSRGVAEEDMRPTVGLIVPLDETSPIFSGGVTVSRHKDREDDRAPRRTRGRKKR